MYVEVTDNGVIRKLELPRQESKYTRLITKNTGFAVVCDKTGKVKQFTEEEVKQELDDAYKANKKKRIPVEDIAVTSNRKIIKE